MKEKTIRGRRVIYEGRGDEADRSWVESLRYSVDVFDERDSLVEVLGRLADLSVAHAAFEAALAKYPGKRLFLRERARVIRRYDEPRD